MHRAIQRPSYAKARGAREQRWDSFRTGSSSFTLLALLFSLSLCFFLSYSRRQPGRIVHLSTAKIFCLPSLTHSLFLSYISSIFILSTTTTTKRCDIRLLVWLSCGRPNVFPVAFHHHHLLPLPILLLFTPQGHNKV